MCLISLSQLKVCSRHTSPDAIIVIENATFYSVADNLLNCSTGPIGPLSIQNQYHKFPPLFHESVNNGDGRHDGNSQLQGPKGWRTTHASSSASSSSSWQSTTTAPTKSKVAADLIAVSRDLRQALNRRCSGMANGRMCSFNLHLDHERSQLWGSGLVDIFYRCVPKHQIENTCSFVSSVSSSHEPSYSKSYKVDFLKIYLL